MWALLQDKDKWRGTGPRTKGNHDAECIDDVVGGGRRRGKVGGVGRSLKSKDGGKGAQEEKDAGGGETEKPSKQAEG